MLPKSTRKALHAAIPKATRSSIKAPKEKHVKNICGATLTRDSAVIEEIIQGLAKRLEKDNWVVVLKTLMVFHRCFRDGDVAFIEALRTRSAAIFGLKRFSITAPAGNIYTLFVQKYAKYLEENVSVLRLIGFQFERNRDCTKDLAPKEAFKRVPKLQSQLNALLNCKMRQHHIGKNPLIISTYMLLLKDSLVLYPMLNVGLFGLIDSCFKMKKKDAQRVLEIYTLFVKETEALISLYDVSRTFTSRLPPIHPAKASLIDALSAHISKLEDGEGDGYSDGEGEAHAEMEPEPDFSQYSANTNQKDYHDDESDTSSESSDDEDHFKTDSLSALPANLQNGQATNMRRDPSIGPNSWGFLTSQPQQQTTQTAQGWDLFDAPSQQFAVTPSSPVNNNPNNDLNDPFAAFTNPVGTSSPIDSLTYSQRAQAVKANMSQHYSAQQQTQQQAQFAQQRSQYDNPFGGPTVTGNPFADTTAPSNPFGGAPMTPQVVQQPAPSTNNNGNSYNPFL